MDERPRRNVKWPSDPRYLFGSKPRVTGAAYCPDMLPPAAWHELTGFLIVSGLFVFGVTFAFACVLWSL